MADVPDHGRRAAAPSCRAWPPGCHDTSSPGEDPARPRTIRRRRHRLAGLGRPCGMPRVDMVSCRAAICAANVPICARSGSINDNTLGSNLSRARLQKPRSMLSAPPISKVVIACRTLIVILLSPSFRWPARRADSLTRRMRRRPAARACAPECAPPVTLAGEGAAAEAGPRSGGLSLSDAARLRLIRDRRIERGRRACHRAAAPLVEALRSRPARAPRRRPADRCAAAPAWRRKRA